MFRHAYASTRCLLLASGLVALSACKSTDTGTDDVLVEFPDNDWYHVAPADFPADLSAEGWAVGDVVPNMSFFDQNGDEVQLHQFYGRTVILDLAGEWCGPCHDMAPYIDLLWHEIDDEAVIVTVLLDNNSFGLAGDGSVQRWVGQHGATNPVVRVPDEASREAFQAWATSYPNLAIIDPTMRMGIHNANDIELDTRISQVMRRVQFMVGGEVGSTEVCDDGVDNDLDMFADCLSAGCASDSACELVSEPGTLGPCGTAWLEGNVVDVWTVDVPAGVAQIEVDTVAEDTLFETIAWVRKLEPETPWLSGLYDLLGDDEFDCAYPAEDFSCARGWVAAGTYEVAIGAGSGGQDDGDCVNPELGAYELRLRGATAVLSEDDVALPF